jgi:hypothetical protein
VLLRRSHDVRSFDDYDAPLIDFITALPDIHKVSA